MQILGPFVDPSQRHRGWIVAENQLALVVALDQSHAFAAAKVDRRPNLHGHLQLPKRR
jgi:hypothetical protein